MLVILLLEVLKLIAVLYGSEHARSSRRHKCLMFDFECVKV